MRLKTCISHYRIFRQTIGSVDDGECMICDSVARTLYKAVGILILTIQGSLYNNIKAECAFGGTWRAGGKCLRKQVLKYSHRHFIGIHG